MWFCWKNIKIESCSPVQHRRLLLELFSSSYRVKRSAVQARLAQELGDVSKADVDRVLHVRPLDKPLVGFFFFLSCFSRGRVVAGVLQQPRRDVVPQGDHRVVTLSRRLRLHSLSSSSQGGRQSHGREPITARPAPTTEICSAQNLRLLCPGEKPNQSRDQCCIAGQRTEARLSQAVGPHRTHVVFHLTFWIDALPLHYFTVKLIPNENIVFFHFTWSIIHKFNIISRQPSSFLFCSFKWFFF